MKLRSVGRGLAAISLAGVCTLAGSSPAPHLPGLQVPLVFEANRGQADPAIRFVARGSGYSLLLKDEGAVLRLPSSELRMRLSGSRGAKSVDALDPQPGSSSYFMGNDPARWRTGIPQSGRVRYTQVYRGIDLVFKSAASNRFEYDFVVSPGADPSTIGVRFDGAESIESDGDGGILLRTASGEILEPRPSIYQDLDSGRKEVPGRMILDKGNIVRFELGAYDHTRTLTIDPVVYQYLYGSDSDSFGAIATDSAGNVYLTGSSTSPDFPLIPGAPKSNAFGTAAAGVFHVFVVKLSPDLQTVMYTAIIGGAGMDNGNAIKVDNAGNAYVVGSTQSNNFPVVHAAQNQYGNKQENPNSDAFILKLDPQGATLLYSTFLGGDGIETGIAMALDATGAVYLTGATDSQFNFPATSGAIDTLPLTNGSQPVYGSNSLLETFAAKISPDGGTFAYAARFGGSSGPIPSAIAIDSSGNTYVAGTVGAGDFPVVGNVVQPYGPGMDGLAPDNQTGFVSELNPTGTAFIFSTYFGGGGNGGVVGIALDPSGTIYLAGNTTGPNLTTTTGVIGPTFLPPANFSQPITSGFVAALNNSATTVLACSYLGGSVESQANAIVVRGPGAIGIAGQALAGAFPGFAAPPSAGGYYLELDPLFQHASNTYSTNLAAQYTGIAVRPDGSVVLGGGTQAYAGKVVVAGTAAPVSPVSISGSTNPATVTAGSNFSYVFTITNGFPSAITNLKISTTFSGASVQITGGSISSGYCPLPEPPAPFNCLDSSLAAAATTTLTVTGTAGAEVQASAASATLTLTWDNGTSQTAQISVNITPPSGSLQFALPVTASATTGVPVAVAVSTPNVFLLDSNVEIFSGAALSPQTPVTVQPGVTPAALLAVDLNGDGVADLAVLDSTADAITTYLATSPGYVQTQTFPTGVGATAIAMLNLTGAPGTGMIAAGANGIALFSSNGDGTFNPSAAFDVSGRQGNLIAVASGSFTGAGFDDLVVADAAGDIWLIPSDGMGGYGNPIMTMADLNPVAFAVGDFNGDGLLDLAVANSGSGDVSILLGDGAGDLGPATNFPVGANPLALAAMDFDQDGNLDLAVVVNGTSTLALLSGDGMGGMGTPLQYAVGTNPIAIAVGDVDGDGMPDIAVASTKPGGVTVLLNQNMPQSSAKSRTRR